MRFGATFAPMYRYYSTIGYGQCISVCFAQNRAESYISVETESQLISRTALLAAIPARASLVPEVL